MNKRKFCHIFLKLIKVNYCNSLYKKEFSVNTKLYIYLSMYLLFSLAL